MTDSAGKDTKGSIEDHPQSLATVHLAATSPGVAWTDQSARLQEHGRCAVEEQRVNMKVIKNVNVTTLISERVRSNESSAIVPQAAPSLEAKASSHMTTQSEHNLMSHPKDLGSYVIQTTDSTQQRPMFRIRFSPTYISRGNNDFLNRNNLLRIFNHLPGLATLVSSDTPQSRSLCAHNGK